MAEELRVELERRANASDAQAAPTADAEVTQVLASGHVAEGADKVPVEVYCDWLNAQVGQHGAPPSWLRTTSLISGAKRAVRLPSAASDVAVTDRLPARPDDQPKVETEGEARDGESRLGNGPLGVQYIRMSRTDTHAAAETDTSLSARDDEGGDADATDATASPPRTVRLVIVSDTHGYESSLTCETPSKASTSSSVRLPEGDILIHCGDFQIDGGATPRAEATAAFDAWFAEQPVTSGLKLVCRGNHDHINARLPLSGAKYAVRPTVYEACGLTIAVVPFTRGRLREPIPDCDILVTHVPPKGVLDQCYNGDRAGSRFLSESVCAGLTRPRLWLCGHVHEGYGYEVVRFGADFDSQGTLVVNAANANKGRANRLEQAPIVVDIPVTKPRPSQWATAVPSGETSRGTTKSLDFASAALSPDPSAESVPTADLRLLAVDLGLRTGLALYDGEGKLIRYAQYSKLTDAVELGDLAEAWLAGEEEEGEADTKRPVTHLAIEGRDVALRDEWAAAALRAAKRLDCKPARLVDVSPEGWRKALLLPKERKTGLAAKAAARLVARQLVLERGTDGAAHSGRFPTDAAEAVLVGYYAIRRLGWVNAEGPAVRRYTNGVVIL